MSTAGVVQLVLWGGGGAFITALFFRSWRRMVRARRTETPEEAYRRAVGRLERGSGRSGRRNLGAAGGFWAAGAGTGWGSHGGDGGGSSGCGGGSSSCGGGACGGGGGCGGGS